MIINKIRVLPIVSNLLGQLLEILGITTTFERDILYFG